MTEIILSTLCAIAITPTKAKPLLQAGLDNECSDLRLWYKAPAKQWIEALPIGNGRLGAMVFGHPNDDHLQLNEITVWSGGPQPNVDRGDAYKNLSTLRDLIRQQKYPEAERLANSKFNSSAPYDDSYQTLGNLDFHFVLPPGPISNYRRQLDIGCAVANTTFQVGHVTYGREVFCSAPAHAIVERIAADRPGSIGFVMGPSRIQSATAVFHNPDTLVMTGKTGDTLRFEVQARVIAKGGRISHLPDGRLAVDGADEAIIIVTAATNYALDYQRGYQGGDPSVAGRQIEAASAQSYSALKSAHLADYERYFGRVTLDLGKPNTLLPTDDRLKNEAVSTDPSLAALFYQFRRYLLISSSRPDNPLPANLQGIWGDGIDLPWKCDYHANINLEMNYWPAGSDNLNEMSLPMLRLILSLALPGAKTAKAYFGPNCPGWVCCYTTNAWGWTSPGKELPWGIWFTGGAWLCRALWDHYAFTQDKDYLLEVYPAMKGAAEFWLANLIEGPDGSLIPSPSTSPENTFTTDQRVTNLQKAD